MDTVRKSLFEAYPKRVEVPGALLISAILLILGLCLPIITLKELIFWKTTFSVWSGIVSLTKEGHQLLALVIFLFSFVFPISKLSVLTGLWFMKLADEKRALLVHWITILGKWSMLDVFVVAITIVITKISKLASAEPRIGIYFFGASVLLTLLITERIEVLMKRQKENEFDSSSILSETEKSPQVKRF